MRGWLIGLIGLAVATGPASAEVRIHLVDRTTPVVSGQVFEEEAWVLYEEGDSGYLFSVPRDRVEKLEMVQGGTVRTIEVTAPGQRVFRDFRRRIFSRVVEAQDKIVEEFRKRLQDEAGRVGAAASATNQARQAGGAEAAQEVRVTLDIQRERVNETIQEYKRAQEVLDRSLARFSKYRISGPKPTYYFFSR